MNTSTIDTKEQLSRKELADLTGVRDSTIKFYSEQGMLPYSQGGRGLARRYDRDQAVTQLRRIGELKALGLNVDAIKAQLAD